MTWVEQTDYGSETIDNIYYCVINSNGEIVKPAANLSGQSYDYQLPFYAKRPLAVTSLQNESAIIIFAGETNLFYSVVNRDGEYLKNVADSGFPINNVDVVQLSGGNIFVAMPVKEDDGWFNYFIIEQVGL